MTMISDPDMPAIDIGPATHTEEQAAVWKPSNARMIGVVAVGALLITAVNITAAVYFYRGINDLRLVERRLEQLGSFEQRIAARLDTVNNGFQSRFEKLDSQLQGSFNEVKGSIARLEQELPLDSDDDMSSIDGAFRDHDQHHGGSSHRSRRSDRTQYRRSAAPAQKEDRGSATSPKLVLPAHSAA